MLMENGKTVGHSLCYMNIHEHLHTQTTVLHSHVGHARVGPVCGVGACMRVSAWRCANYCVSSNVKNMA